MSILPIGIEKFSGNCKKGDLIDIFSSNNEKVGVGISRYDFNKLNEYLGEKNKPAFIHYDHLHVF